MPGALKAICTHAWVLPAGKAQTNTTETPKCGVHMENNQ